MELSNHLPSARGTNPVQSKIKRNQLDEGRGAAKDSNLLKRWKAIAQNGKAQRNRRGHLRRLRAERRPQGAVPNNLASRANQSGINRRGSMEATLPYGGWLCLKEIRIVVMKNGQKEKMDLQQHQGAGKGRPQVTIPEVTSHNHSFYQRFSRPAHENVRSGAISRAALT